LEKTVTDTPLLGYSNEMEGAAWTSGRAMSMGRAAIIDKVFHPVKTCKRTILVIRKLIGLL
jgi:hypothetical protein